MYVVKLMGFRELETRAFCPIGTLGEFHEYEDADEFASECSNELAPVEWVLCRAHNIDGITIDVCNVHGDVEVSYEYIPGRPMTAYYGDECHE